MSLIKKVRETVRRFDLLSRNDKIVVGVSGGPDSVALLYLLNTLKKELKLSLHIAHLDHGIRKDSYKDREFVEGLAKQLRLPITTAQINVKELAKKGSLEEIARKARLGFLFKVAKDIKAKKIALGHNLDDQAETVLMRILRGTGLYGLSGILPKRYIAGYQLIRPLIEVRRKDIEIFLKRRKISPCLDTSNLEDIHFRNKIRNRLLPLLEKDYNRNIKKVLSNMAESVGCDYDYLNRMVERAMKRQNTKINLVPSLKGLGRTIPVGLEKFSKLHLSVQRMVLRQVYAKIKGDTRRLEFRHIKEIEDLVSSRPINSIVNLPCGISVKKKKRNLLFLTEKDKVI